MEQMRNPDHGLRAPRHSGQTNAWDAYVADRKSKGFTIIQVTPSLRRQRRSGRGRHGARPAELFVRFGRRGDQPLLGDLDGDGQDDPCVFRKGRLLCDTAHDGGAAEGMLSLGGPKDRVVLGNLDGL